MGSTAIDNERVCGIVERELAGAGDVTAALRRLQARRRQPGAEQDAALIAAEHYLFGRHAARAAVDAAQLEAMVIGYDAAGGLARLFAGLDRLAGVAAPRTAPTSLAAVRWGLRGAADGLALRGDARAPAGRCQGAPLAPCPARAA